MSDQPTPISAFVFAAKVAAHRARRHATDMISGPAKLPRAATGDFPVVVARSSTPLWSDETVSEHAMQRGKVHNLRIAARMFDGVEIPAGSVFSFWRQLGPPRAGRGFAKGRMLKQGCLMPVVGGGLCQLSNALYDVALRAGCDILERHAHSRIVPGSVAEAGRDATVAWNYVDLRFAPPQDMRLTVRMDKTNLTVALAARHGVETVATPCIALPRMARTANSCASCGETECHFHRRDALITQRSTDRAAFLVDEAWPEFQEYVQSVRRAEDWFGTPRRATWSVDGFARRFDTPLQAVRRSLGIRGARTAPDRRQAERVSAEAIARCLAERLSPEVTELTVAQSFVPFLWRDGHLGGRSVSVLMTRLPAAILHRRLDDAFIAHPDRASLNDFRWPAALVQAEADALAQADRIVTPHAEIAALFPGRATLLAWSMVPAAKANVRRPIRRIAFPGPTIARKGAYAVRDAARHLGLEVVLFGNQFEGAGFWRGVETFQAQDWTGVDAVVQPSVAEEQPRRLLTALAMGIPVFASRACGLGPRPGVTIVPPDDTPALIAALEALA